MTDTTSLPLDIARNPQELALLRLFRLIPEEKQEEAMDNLVILLSGPGPRRKKPKARQD